MSLRKRIVLSGCLQTPSPSGSPAAGEMKGWAPLTISFELLSFLSKNFQKLQLGFAISQLGTCEEIFPWLQTTKTWGIFCTSEGSVFAAVSGESQLSFEKESFWSIWLQFLKTIVTICSVHIYAWQLQDNELGICKNFWGATHFTLLQCLLSFPRQS